MYTKKSDGIKTGRKSPRANNTARAALAVLGLVCILCAAAASDAEVFGISQLFVSVTAGTALLLAGAGSKKLKILSGILIRKMAKHAGLVAANLSAFALLSRQSGLFGVAWPVTDRRKTLSKPPDFEICIESETGFGTAAADPCPAAFRKCS